jgi:acylphosphatase
MAQRRIILKIHGLVQGMGYRYWSSQEAQKRGFTGYVRNCDDGSVEIVAEGKEKDLKDFIQWCYNGVGTAQVTKIDVSWSKATDEFKEFSISF